MIGRLSFISTFLIALLSVQELPYAKLRERPLAKQVLDLPQLAAIRPITDTVASGQSVGINPVEYDLVGSARAAWGGPTAAKRR